MLHQQKISNNISNNINKKNLADIIYAINFFELNFINHTNYKLSINNFSLIEKSNFDFNPNFNFNTEHKRQINRFRYNNQKRNNKKSNY